LHQRCNTVPCNTALVLQCCLRTRIAWRELHSYFNTHSREHCHASALQYSSKNALHPIHKAAQCCLCIRIFSCFPFLGGEYPSQSLHSAGGAHPINYVRPKNLSWTVADRARGSFLVLFRRSPLPISYSPYGRIFCGSLAKVAASQVYILLRGPHTTPRKIFFSNKNSDFCRAPSG